jgi:hypothetical protein
VCLERRGSFFGFAQRLNEGELFQVTTGREDDSFKYRSDCSGLPIIFMVGEGHLEGLSLWLTQEGSVAEKSVPRANP